MDQIYNSMNLLQNRLIDLASDVYELTKPYQKEQFLESAIKQVLKSSTSVGANYSESQNTGTYRDFFNKIKIAQKELNETMFWIKYLARVKKGYIQTEKLEQEIEELQRIFATISKKADQKLNMNKKK